MMLLVISIVTSCCLCPEPIPTWIPTGPPSTTRTQDELSIVCPEPAYASQRQVRSRLGGAKTRRPISVHRERRPVVFPRAVGRTQTPIVAVSTFDTDYVLIKLDNLEAAVDALKKAGHQQIG